MNQLPTRHEGQVNDIIFSIIDKLRFAFKFRLRGGRLLSLCGESKQRRIKGKRETVRSGFPLSFEILSPFDRSRNASVAEAPGAYRIDNTSVVPATFRFNRQRRGDYLTQSIT